MLFLLVHAKLGNNCDVARGETGLALAGDQGLPARLQNVIEKSEFYYVPVGGGHIQ